MTPGGCRTPNRARGASRLRPTVALLLVGLALLAPSRSGAGYDASSSARPSSVGVSLTASPLSGIAPFVVNLRATVTPVNLTATFNWTFGDGSSFSQIATAYSAVAHSYNTVGSFIAKVFLSSTDGDANASLLVQSSASGLLVQLLADPLTGPAPLTVHFVCDIGGGTGTYTAILWRFGDGGNGSGSDLEYTYARPGVFETVVNVTDSSGATTSASVNITVTPGPLPSTGGSGSDAPPYYALALPLALVLAAAAIAAVVYRSLTARRTEAAGPAAPPTVRAGAKEGAVVSGLADPPAGPATPEAMEAAAPGLSVQDDSRRLSERLLVHLYWYGRPSADGVARPDSSQGGMTRRLGVGQNSISKALQRLVDAGLVTVELRHVPGAPRRLRTYSLTPRGESAARSIRADLDRRPPV